jgi:hypothetical protein
MARPLSRQSADAVTATPKRKRRRSPGYHRREAARNAERIERASADRRVARSSGEARRAYALTVELLGPDAGEAPRHAKKRADPYLKSHGGLFAEKREAAVRASTVIADGPVKPT